ncbi:unnamed protein product [Blepharisma stoltei]|uniref:VASt domain-containing protein n=1 Tax=Blepharisma stoltei TaxID=1481888 RepID=A0AAU9JN24_9CILI|nr:unnamed protein product [Blepharisma stoltei]
MNVLNDLFTGGKPEFPEQQQYLELWNTSLDNFRKNIKYIGSFLSDITINFDQYGKSLSRSGKNLISYLLKIETKSNTNIAESMKKFGNFSEMLGDVYSKSSSSLNSMINQRIQKLTEDTSQTRKKMVEETQQAMQDLSKSKANYTKIKAKYDKAVKDSENLHAAFTKAKNDASSNFQVGVEQRFKEKSNASKKECASLQEELKEQIDLINHKHEILETVLKLANYQNIELEKESMITLHDLAHSVICMVRNVLALRKEQSEIKHNEIAELANITLDMIDNNKDNKQRNSIEYLMQKLEQRLNANEDRSKALRGFKTYLSEIMNADESLGKGLEKIGVALMLPDYYTSKKECKAEWLIFNNIFIEISKIHIKFSKEIAKKGSEPLQALIDLKTNIAKKLQTSVQKSIRDHAIIQEEGLKDFEKIKKNEEKKALEIRDRIQNSFQNAEHQVYSSMAENTNLEASHLQNLKGVLATLHMLEEEYNHLIDSLIEKGKQEIENINVEDDFKDQVLYEKKSSLDLSLEISNQRQSLEFEENKNYQNPSEENSILQKFNLEAGSTLVESFACALSKKILLHGRMYLTTTHICFHSYFNSQTIFGRETLLAIPFAEIKKVEKKIHGLIFDNALRITTDNSEFIFASFLYREQAKATVENLIRLNKPSQNAAQKTACEFKIETREKRLQLAKLMKTLKVKTEPVSNRKPESFFKVTLLKDPLSFDVPAQKIFELLFADSAKDFLEKFMELKNETDMKLTQWEPSAPDFYLNQPGESWNESSVRSLDYIRPMKERFPMMPKTHGVHEQQTIYFISKNEFIFEILIKTSGVPFSDCFQAHLRWHVKEVDGKTSLVGRYWMEFLKSTMFSGKIERTSVAETINVINEIWVPLVKNKVNGFLGEKVEEIVPKVKEPVKEENTDFNWMGWAFIGILVIILIIFWNRISRLENDVNRLSVLISKMDHYKIPN